MEELLAGTVTLHGDTYEIRWLDGDEFADAKIVMGVADLWTAVSDPMGGDLIVDSDIERLLRRVVTDVFDDDSGAVHSGDPQTAEAHLINVATVAGADPRRAQLRLTHDWIGLTLTDLDIGTVLFDYDEYDEHEMEAALRELAQVA